MQVIINNSAAIYKIKEKIARNCKRTSKCIGHLFICTLLMSFILTIISIWNIILISKTVCVCVCQTMKNISPRVYTR